VEFRSFVRGGGERASAFFRRAAVSDRSLHNLALFPAPGSFHFAQLTTECNFRAFQRLLLTALLELGFWRVAVQCWPNLKSPMTTKTLEIALEDPGGLEYPNCYAAIPPNGKVCPHTGLRHTHLYTMLAVGGTARPHVRVVSLREPGARKGKTLFHVGDFLRHLDRLAAQQGSGALRNARTE
jgi:hypothetical protein